ncbi:MAG: ribonuclease HI [Candidatus Woesearchaeota archaeon]
MKTVDIYTDGACSGNPGPGGWGAVLLYNGHKKEISGSEEHTTNNRMELKAVIESLKIIKQKCIINIHTDSSYIYRAFTDNWVEKWKNNNWKNSKKDAVLNKDLWEELIQYSKKYNINWFKVKGHSDNKYNNIADKLATSAIVKK